MRVSTSMIYDAGVAAMLRQQDALSQTQQRVASGKRMLSAADDPVAATQALAVSQADAANTQYATNRDTAKNLLGLTENALQSVTNVLQNARSVAVSAGSAVLSDSDRASLAQELLGAKNELLGLANSSDGSGGYLFAGFQNAGPAFSQGASSVQYLGDQGQRLIQVNASRQLPASESGMQVFQNMKTGNGVFTASAAASNTGTGTISQGSVTNPAALTGHSYRVDFTVSGGATTYNIVDTTIPATLSGPNPYTPGASISFAGEQVQIDGAPANGDQFTVAPSSRQSIFDTLDQFITALQTPVAGSTGGARIANSVSASLANIDQALSRVLDVRAGVGSRLNEVDALASAGTDLGLEYKQTLSQLQDLDYASAISTLDQQQIALEAAQKSFVQVAGLSLFKYL